jgi:N-acetylmuramoyl-L-alanine amidase
MRRSSADPPPPTGTPPVGTSPVGAPPAPTGGILGPDPLWHRSPHHSSRRGAAIQWIVLHADMSPAESITLDWLANPASKVSYHVLVHRTGAVTRVVPDERAAWACGVSRWQQVEYLNRYSLSLAFANRHDGREPITTAQLAAAVALCQAWMRRHPTIRAVLTHRAISPGRKTDPTRVPNWDAIWEHFHSLGA